LEFDVDAIREYFPALSDGTAFRPHASRLTPCRTRR